MKHYVYKITNLLNCKIYIGIHSSLNPEKDGYMGSGKLIKNAIKKYGKNNFKKEILITLDCRNAAIEYERLIVNEEFVKNENSYNLIIGGTDSHQLGKKKKFVKRGPMPEHVREKISAAQRGKKRQPLSIEHRKKLSEVKKGITPKNMLGDNKAKTIEKIAAIARKKYKSGERIHHYTGKQRSKEDREKISNSLKGNIPWNAGKKMNNDFKAKCKNIPVEKKGGRKLLIEKLKKINFTYEGFKNFVKDQHDSGNGPIKILKMLPADCGFSESPIKFIIKGLKNELS